MKFQDQTTFGGPHTSKEERGNCYAACIASILGLPLETVPNFCAGGEAWFSETNKWLHENCGVVISTWREDPFGAYPKEYGEAVYIASGKSPRGDWNHSVVWSRGSVLHDPHPSRAGIVGDPLEWDVFLVTDVDRLRSKEGAQ